MTNSIIIPSDPESRRKLKGYVKEIEVELCRMDAARQSIKDILETVKMESEIPPKYVKKCANVFHKQNFEAQRTESEDFATLFETLFQESEG